VGKERIRNINIGWSGMKKIIDPGHTDKNVTYAEHTAKMNGMLTVREVARMLNVHLNTVRRWSNLGILKSFRIGLRGDRRFLKEDVDKFLRE
jgi:excisionase family DNA binding protein